jgi:hypothetical protein
MLTPDRILQAAFGFRASKTLMSALELGLFTELGKGPRSVRQLCRSLDVEHDAVAELLDALVTLGFLNREGIDDGALYMNTRESGHFLDRNSPAYLGAVLDQSMGKPR